MTAKRLIPLLVLCALSAPVFGEAPNLNSSARGIKGAVATVALAQDLYAQGVARKDALTVLTAARMAGSVDLQDSAQKKTTEGVPVADQEGATGTPAIAADMMATAVALAGEDEQLASLIETAKSETSGPRSTALVTQSTLPAGQSDVWELAFFGDSYGEIAVIGDGGANLDVTVTDAAGNLICKDVSWTDRAYCDFVPAANGYFHITVANEGARANAYALLTN